jgi:hypothetical protein
MATTTNYGWTTPDDTALVKDGASAIRSLGTSVDTTTKALNPSTTLGDIEYRSSTANTNTRLGIGSTGQVLTVSGGVPSWATASGGAGNMVQIATGTLSGASVVISSLSTYTDIVVFLYGTTNNTAAGTAYLRLNATSTNHDTRGLRQTGNTAYDAFGAVNDTDFYLSGEATIRTDTTNAYVVKLTNCKNSGFTDIDIAGRYVPNASGTNGFYIAKGVYTKSEAVSSITLRNSGGTWAGGTYTVWGA